MSRRVLVHLEAHQVHFQHPDGDSIQSFCGLRDTDFHDQLEEGKYGTRWVVTCSECKRLMAEQDEAANAYRCEQGGAS